MKHSTDLGLDELCKLVQFCNNNGVKEIKLDKIEIVFKESHLQKECDKPEAESVSKQNNFAPEFIEEVDPAVLRQLEADIKQAQLDQMMLTDPVQFEELIIAGDFQNDGREE